MKDQFSHFACVLPVTTVTQSLEFYREKLGFSVEFKWNDPVDYAVIRRGESVSIHLTKSEKTIPRTDQPKMYIFLHSVDEVYKEYKAKSVEFHTPIGDREYGMRDFDILDPDGHMITFGTGIS